MRLDGLFNVAVSKQELPNHFTQQMGALIERARKELGLSQGDLASDLGLSSKTIAAIESGSREVGVFELVQLGRILQRPLLYFLPPAYRQTLEPSLSMSDFDLLMLFGRLSETDRAKVLAQLRGLVEYLTIGA